MTRQGCSTDLREYNIQDPLQDLPPSIIFLLEKKKLLYVPVPEDSEEGKQQAAQDLELEEDKEPTPEQNKEANLGMEAAAEQGQSHGLA